jgi:predicted phosphodiesterase
VATRPPRPRAAGSDVWLPGPWAADPEPRFERIAIFGGVYSNHLALKRVLEDARARNVDAVLCLGDLGAFGPNPDRSCEFLRAQEVAVVRGNYDDSLARGLADCQCGYTDPRDNHFARLSYDYTLANTSDEHRGWMGTFPESLRFRLGEARVLGFHGSPRRTNEFLWETATPTRFLQRFADEWRADILVGTHTGLHWSRALGSGRWYVNVGAIGRPANDGRTEVRYAVLEAGPAGTVHEFVPISYDHDALAAEMEAERLPREFIETVRTGWWTTCLEILPGKERARGRW